jgi:hypothetical protein
VKSRRVADGYKREIKFTALPPKDFKGTMTDWMVALIALGYWDGHLPQRLEYLHLSQRKWWAALEYAEGKAREKTKDVKPEVA